MKNNMIKKLNKKYIIDKLKLFSTGFLQVSLVAVQTIFLSHGIVWGILLFGFGISIVWSHNIKKIAFGFMSDRIIYSLGAMTGAYIGYLFTKLFI